MATRRCSSARNPPSSKYFSARAMAPSRDPVMRVLVSFGGTIADYRFPPHACLGRWPQAGGEFEMLTSGRIVFTAMEEVQYGKPADKALAVLVEAKGAQRVFLMVSGTLNRETDEIE